MDEKVLAKKDSKKSKSKRKDKTVRDDVKLWDLKNKESIQVGGGKSKGEVSTAEFSNPRGGVEVEKGKKAARIKIAIEKQNADDAITPMKRKRSTDEEITQAFLSSPESGSSRLRPRKDCPSFRMVELNESDSKRIVGMRVKVYWSGSRKWFVGSIKSFDNEKGLHKIHYDDGDKEELDLRHERFELEIKPSDGFRLRTKPHSKKKVKGFDDDKINAEILMEDSMKVGNVEQLKGNVEPKKSKVSKKAARGRSSKSQVKKDTEDKKAEDVVSEMDVAMLPEKVDEAIPDEVHDADKPSFSSFEKEHDESKIVTEIAGEAKESLEWQATKTEPDSEKPKLVSNGCEKSGSATKAVGDGTDEVSLDFQSSKPESLLEGENPKIVLSSLKTESSESARDTSKEKESISEEGINTISYGLQQLADNQSGNDETQVDWDSQKMGLIGGSDTGTVESLQTRKFDSHDIAEGLKNPIRRGRTKIQRK